MSRRDGGSHAATLVFQLVSKVDTRAPLKRVRVEGPLYELQQFEINVSNPFPSGEITFYPYECINTSPKRQ
jgi:propanediol utilization protein